MVWDLCVFALCEFELRRRVYFLAPEEAWLPTWGPTWDLWVGAGVLTPWKKCDVEIGTVIFWKYGRLGLCEIGTMQFLER